MDEEVTTPVPGSGALTDPELSVDPGVSSGGGIGIATSAAPTLVGAFASFAGDGRTPL